MAATLLAHRHHHRIYLNPVQTIRGLATSVASVFGQDEGASTVESALVLILISVTVLVGIQAVGTESARLWTPIQAAVASIPAP